MAYLTIVRYSIARREFSAVMYYMHHLTNASIMPKCNNLIHLPLTHWIIFSIKLSPPFTTSLPKVKNQLHVRIGYYNCQLLLTVITYKQYDFCN